MMGIRWWFDHLAVSLVVVAGILTFGTVTTAQASTPETPPDVLEALSLGVVESAAADSEGMPGLGLAASFGDVHRVHRWSESLLGGDGADPVTAADEWVAPILSSTGAGVGVYRVWRETPEREAEFAGIDADAATAAALAEVATDATLIEDATIAAWYVLDDGVVTPVGSARFDDIRTPTPIDEVAGIVAERYDRNISEAAAPLGVTGDRWMWVGLGVLAIGAAGIGVVAFYRRPAG